MTALALVFALEISYWDAPPESGSTETIAKPDLEVFSNAVLAAASNEGINIAEGDLWFFAADGSPLEAVFSERPYVDTERLKYLAGKYALQAGCGKPLRESIWDILSEVPMPGAQIVVRVANSNEVAREHGWSDVDAMKSSIEQALEAAVPDLINLVVFETCRH